VTGGGVRLEDVGNMGVADSHPTAGGRGWTANVDNDDPARPHGYTVYAICTASAVTG
jgi:hypothetical protein